MIDWANVIFVMERKHRDILKQRFCFLSQTIIVLDITDDYQFGEPELIEVLKRGLVDYF